MFTVMSVARGVCVDHPGPSCSGSGREKLGGSITRALETFTWDWEGEGRGGACVEYLCAFPGWSVGGAMTVTVMKGRRRGGGAEGWVWHWKWMRHVRVLSASI